MVIQFFCFIKICKQWSNFEKKKSRAQQRHRPEFLARNEAFLVRFFSLQSIARAKKVQKCKSAMALAGHHRSATLAFKYMMGSAPDYLTSEFTKRFNISGRETRNSQSLHIPLFKSASGQRSFYYRTVKIWKSLDNELKLSKDDLSFKRELKSTLLFSA